MAYWGVGNRTVFSTNVSSLGQITAPTTAVLLAEIDLNGTNAVVQGGGATWQVTWIPSNASATGVSFVCEHVLSTGLGSTAMRDIFPVSMSSNQSAQYVTRHNVEPGDRFRMRLVSTVAGNVGAKIIAEPLA